MLVDLLFKRVEFVGIKKFGKRDLKPVTDFLYRRKLLIVASAVNYVVKRGLSYPADSGEFVYSSAVAGAETGIARENFAANIAAAPEADVPFSLKYLIKGNPRNSQIINEVASDDLI